MKVLFCSSEALPFAATGGLADVAGSLPQALRTRLIGCRVVMPLYESVPQELREKMKFLTSISVPVAWRRQYCGIFEAKVGNVIYYLIDNQYYFKRQGLYGHFDDAERFAFFSRAVLEMLPYIEFKPDIIHVNDWQTALLYITTDKKKPLQLLLINIQKSIEFLLNNSNVPASARAAMGGNIPQYSSTMATVLVVIGPIMIVYPFFQKYFVKGLTVGSVKG